MVRLIKSGHARTPQNPHSYWHSGFSVVFRYFAGHREVSLENGTYCFSGLPARSLAVALMRQVSQSYDSSKVRHTSAAHQGHAGTA